VGEPAPKLAKVTIPATQAAASAFPGHGGGSQRGGIRFTHVFRPTGNITSMFRKKTSLMPACIRVACRPRPRWSSSSTAWRGAQGNRWAGIHRSPRSRWPVGRKAMRESPSATQVRRAGVIHTSNVQGH
jgi:hypothetical protein